MKKKRSFLFTIISVVLIAAIFAGCGSGAPSSGGASSGGGAATNQKYNFRLSSHYPEGHSALEALDRAIAKLEELSGGNITVQVFPSSSLGDYSLAYQDMMKGALDMALVTVASEFDPKLEIGYLPGLVSSYEQVEQVFGVDSYFFETYNQINENLGIKYLGPYSEGFHGVGIKVQPENYADPLVKKTNLVRSPNMEAFTLPLQDIGYNTVNIPYADLYSALQTGVADGWTGGSAVLNYTGFRDVIKYYIPYDYSLENNAFLMSKKVYDGLPEEYQKMISDVFMEEALRSFKDAEAINDQAMKDMEAYGITILELTDAEREAITAQIREVTWPQLEERYGKEIMDGLKSSLS